MKARKPSVRVSRCQYRKLVNLYTCISWSSDKRDHCIW